MGNPRDLGWGEGTYIMLFTKSYLHVYTYIHNNYICRERERDVYITKPLPIEIERERDRCIAYITKTMYLHIYIIYIYCLLPIDNCL